MNLKLEDDVVSPQDLKAVILELRKYAHWFSQYAIKTRVSGAQSEESPAVSQSTADIMEKWSDTKKLDQHSLEELITSLEALVTSLPHITITLAAAPPQSLKKMIVGWCREHIARNILVDFRFNATILGGMVVHYESHVYDWSFRRQIMANREQFGEVLRRV